MLCTNGHNNKSDAAICSICGINTFSNPVIVAKSATATNGMAIASMVLGIVWVWGLGSVMALILGYAAKREIRRTGQNDSGMATAGIVLGWIGVVGLVFFILTVGAFFHAVHNIPTNPQFNQ
ncbi:MAG TPA: DUF4190 domain-containing protein [Acidimicrobiales bacterium]